MSEVDEIALRKEQLEAAIQAQLNKNKAIALGEADPSVPVGASEFQKQQRQKRAAKRRQEELLNSLEEVDENLLGNKTPRTDDTTKQRKRIDDRLAEMEE